MTELEKIDWVYSRLEDEESRFIFEKRKKFYLTGDYRYLGEIIDKYVPEFSECKWNPEIEKGLVHIIWERRKKVVIFGAGYNGRKVLQLISRGGGGLVDCFCDNNEKKQHTKVDGIEVISLRELLEKEGMEDYIIIISPVTKSICEEIFVLLAAQGIPESNIYKYMDYYFVKELFEEQYFDEVLTFGENEVFVDGGCCDFKNSEIFIKKMDKLGFDYKIYAFEPDKTNIQNCEKRIKELGISNVELMPFGLWEKNACMEFYALENASSHFSEFESLGDVSECLKPLNEVSESVEVRSLDSCIKEKVTFIKMDIEGAELEALKGAEQILCKDKPKLAICIYHKKEDLWEIPYYIKTLVPEYKLYIRHYSNYAHETVLYAVCREEV